MYRNKRTILLRLALAWALFADVANADFTFGTPTNLGLTVNSGADEWGSSISSDGLELYFESNRPGGEGGYDLWVATRATTEDVWVAPVNLGPTVNSSSDEAMPEISADGLELYFGSTRPGGSGISDIWVTTRRTKEDPWEEPANLGSTVNSSWIETGPRISADGLTLYYNSSRPGSTGEWDLWMTTRATINDEWGEPVSLMPAGYSCLSTDGLVLFFQDGNFDIQMAQRKSTGEPFGPTVRLPSQINTSRIEGAPTLSFDGSTLYFASTDSGGFWNDIWQAPIIPIVDFNGDGRVDAKDSSLLMDHSGLDEPLYDIGPMPWGDGVVDIQDLCVLAEYVDVKDVVMVHTPSSHAADVPHDVILQWLPAEIADAHDVYLGTSFEDVCAASRDDPRDVLVSQGQNTSDLDPGPLAFGQTYFWRVDEVTATFEPTIYKGVVMDFTTEPLGYPIDNVSATASTSEAGAGPENTVNGSGLSANGEHSIASGDMWLAVPGTEPLWIQYEFDRLYQLHQMLVWNYNGQFELALGFGIKDVTVEYSVDGVEWTVLTDAVLAQAPARANYAANTTVDFGDVTARFVRLAVNSGYGLLGQFGLSEVQFLYIPVHAREPQPADGETDVTVDTALSWRAGREAVLHEVYLSTDRQAVVDGTALVDTVTESSYQPDSLDRGQTYYWKINELDEDKPAGIWEGDVWEFTTAD